MAITLTTSIGPVFLKEMFEGYEAGIDPTRGPYIKKLYLCPSFESTFPVINALKGLGSGPIPHTCPESANLRCLDARLDPRAEVDAHDGGRPRFNLPVVEAIYGVLTWEALPTDDPAGSQSFPNEEAPGTPYLFMEQSIDFDVETIKLPRGAFLFPSDASKVDTPYARSIGVAQFTLIRRWQSTLPYLNVTTYMNTLNASTFLGQPMGQIKFRKCRTQRQFQSDGTKSQEIALTFLWREYDHNAFHRPDRSAFEVIADSTGANPYKYKNLAALLA